MSRISTIHWLSFSFPCLLLLLPSSQAAVQLMNTCVTTLLPPSILPKLDFIEGIPDDCVTMVAVPTLLLNEEQVRGSWKVWKYGT